MIELLVAISIFGLLGCVLISVLGTAGNRDIIILTRMMVFGAAMLKKNARLFLRIREYCHGNRLSCPFFQWTFFNIETSRKYWPSVKSTINSKKRREEERNLMQSFL